MAGLAGAAEDYAHRTQGSGAIGAYGSGAQYLGDDGLCQTGWNAWPFGIVSFGESLGKEGKGSVPVNTLGPVDNVDQHSQMQLAGPDDTILHRAEPSNMAAPAMPEDFYADDDGLASLVGHTMGNLVDAEARGTMDTLAKPDVRCAIWRSII